jgi:hypothetical protein
VNIVVIALVVNQLNIIDGSAAAGKAARCDYAAYYYTGHPPAYCNIILDDLPSSLGGIVF